MARVRPCAFEFLEPRALLSAPTAALSGTSLSVNGDPYLNWYAYVNYHSDSSDIDASSLGTDDLRVYGQNGYAPVPVALGSVNYGATRHDVSVAYQFTPARGRFDSSDNGNL